MGCIISKLRAEDVVSRCRARKRLMKQAVEYRHGFAAAHAAYVQALKNTGSALRQFAEGEGGLPASGPDPFARSPEPPPPPPPLPGHSTHASLESDAVPDSPLNQTLASTLTLDSPAAHKEWDFFEPFDPSEPPLHLQEQRNAMTPKTEAVCDVDDSNAEITSHADELKQSTPNAQKDGSQNSEEIAETHDNIRNESKDGNPSQNDASQQSQSIKENAQYANESKEGPTETTTHELPSEDRAEPELGLMLRLNVKKDLIGIARELDEEFLKAASGAVGVTCMLETRKPHIRPILAKGRFRKYNSARVFSTFSWNRWRNPLLTKEELESNLDEAGRKTSHALTLERLLAWEKKLFEEVKVVESLCVEREKKCSRLRRQETKGEDASEIDKTRAEIKRLHSLIMISYQGVESTIEAIEDLRDDELHPQLVGLIDELMNMWVIMHQCHAKQTQIIIHIKSLDATISQEPTSEAHHRATSQLEKELHGWYESFCKLVATQRGYIAALYGWLKLSLVPIPTGKEKKRSSEDDDEKGEVMEIYRICEEWQRALGCLPDKVASEAIKSLEEVVKATVGKQWEEMKQKKKAEKLEKQWEKKVQELKPWEEEEEEEENRRSRGRRRSDNDNDGGGEERGMSRMMPAIGWMERKEAVGVMRKKVEGEMMKHGKAVQDTRVFTMNNLQTGLPGVLEAMTGFSAVCSQAFQHLHALTRFHAHD